jgi:pilus assembly protein CpaC
MRMQRALALAERYAPGKITNLMEVTGSQQVMLAVRFAEVSREVIKQLGANTDLSFANGDIEIAGSFGNGPLLDPTSFGATAFALTTGDVALNTVLDALEERGVVRTLAEPNLIALSGDTASFLAGGEFPIPVSQSLGAVAIEYKQYGVGLAFTPIVLADGRISMRVRPEVSELSDAGSVTLNGFRVPALTTRRAETTVELGSGQSFMLAGLLRNSNTNSVDKAPFLGDLPIIGALFRSTKYRRQETELVIIVTPYLVRPVGGQMALPTNGYRAPTDAQQMLLGQTYTGESGRPAVQPAPAPAIGGTATTAAAPGFKL